ncbi:hypothetical protein [Streptomyces sp. BH104]|uniref:hypothetical protein n=1 Tax=Streptomyces sp. BH104 TaxID=3410407 RepID=UPI003BB4FAC7
MSENENATPVEESTNPQPAENVDISTDDKSSANKEAAKYRTKLREAEAKLEAADARVSGLLRKSVETYVASKLSVPGDLFDIGKVAVADLLDGEGNLDTETIDSAVEALLQERPGLSNGPRPWGDVGGGNRNSAESAQPTWSDALRGR